MNTHKPLTIEEIDKIEGVIKERYQGEALDLISRLCAMARQSLEPKPRESDQNCNESKDAFIFGPGETPPEGDRELGHKLLLALAEITDDQFGVKQRNVVEEFIKNIRAETQALACQPKPVVSREEFLDWCSEIYKDRCRKSIHPDSAWPGLSEAYDFLASRTCLDLPSEDDIINALCLFDASDYAKSYNDGVRACFKELRARIKASGNASVESVREEYDGRLAKQAIKLGQMQAALEDQRDWRKCASESDLIAKCERALADKLAQEYRLMMTVSKSRALREYAAARGEKV